MGHPVPVTSHLTTDQLHTVVELWLAGFGRSRRVPVRRIGAVAEVEVGGEERRQELVLVEPDEILLGNTLDRVLATTDVWSTVFTREVRLWQLPPGIIERLTDEVLMTVDLRVNASRDVARGPGPSLGRVDLVVEGDRALVQVLVHGHDDVVLAAHGQVAVVSGEAVFDRIRTEDDYRRRGLGTVVMDALTHWAVAQGATRGLLAASADGQGLYRAMGWRSAAAMRTFSGASDGASDGAVSHRPQG